MDVGDGCEGEERGEGYGYGEIGNVVPEVYAFVGLEFGHGGRRAV